MFLIPFGGSCRERCWLKIRKEYILWGWGQQTSSCSQNNKDRNSDQSSCIGWSNGLFQQPKPLQPPEGKHVACLCQERSYLSSPLAPKRRSLYAGPEKWRCHSLRGQHFDPAPQEARWATCRDASHLYGSRAQDQGDVWIVLRKCDLLCLAKTEVRPSLQISSWNKQMAESHGQGQRGGDGGAGGAIC